MYKSSFLSISPEAAPFFYLVLLFDLLLKGIALYKSAQKNQTVWFVALLVVNSMGILPIIYLLLNKDIAFKSSAKIPAKVSKRKK